MRISNKLPSLCNLIKVKIKNIFSVSTLHRMMHAILNRLLSIILLMLWDAASTAVAVIIGFGMHYGFDGMSASVIEFLKEYIILSIIVLLSGTILCGCYSGVWKRAGIGDFARVVAATAVVTIVMSFIVSVKQLQSVLPPELIAIVAMLELLFITMARAAIRFSWWVSVHVSLIRRRNRMKRVLVYGAGQVGADLVQKLVTHPENDRRPVLFVDDSEGMWGKKVAGLRVAGGRDKLEAAIREYSIDEVIMAITTADSEMLKDVLMRCHKMHCTLKRFGTFYDVNEKNLVNAPISNINLEDLLKRDSVTLNMNIVKGFIEGKTVLVTGGAGSIGSEICRQVLSFGAERLIVFDISENGLFDIQNELSGKFPKDRFVLCLGSIRDSARVNEVFNEYRPQVVFHAAAHKHVPMMEFNPREAVKNNVFGTINVAQAAVDCRAEKFILISTDKAVNPANIMGASKRIAEMAVQLFTGNGKTDFAAVRFGNVLGSSGSVVPYFKKQIEAGGPVTVTHPQVRRYFMTIPEAVQLVLEAGAMAKGGETFVLDMGKPVLIYDLACDLIRLSGFDPDKDIKIIFTGLRPGEKLFEEISLADEDVGKTTNNKIYICKPVDYDEKKLRELIKELGERVNASDERGIFSCVGRLVPTFNDNRP